MTDNYQEPVEETFNDAADATEETVKDTFNQFLHHQKRALSELNKAADSLIPPGVKEHGTEAGREFAKGMKVLVDAAIVEMEKLSKEFEKARDSVEEAADRPSSTGATKVKVQVD